MGLYVWAAAPLPPSCPSQTPWPTQNMQLKHKSLPPACATLQVFEEMKTVRKLNPTATTYGCLLKVCDLRHDVDTAFKLYEEAFEVGVLATDECHNMLIDVCSDAGRWGTSSHCVMSATCVDDFAKQQPKNAPVCVPSLCILPQWSCVGDASACGSFCMSHTWSDILKWGVLVSGLVECKCAGLVDRSTVERQHALY